MGRDKAHVEWRGVPMAERVAGALARCVERVRVVVRPDAAAPVTFERIEDAHEERAAMVGICSALRACDASAVLIAACDLPELDPRVVLALLALSPATTGPEIVAACGPDGPEPLLAVYRPELIPELERRIRAGQLSLRALLEDRAALLIPEADLRRLDPELRSIRNANRPEDVALQPER